MPSLKLRFQHHFYTTRVPLDPKIQVPLEGWKKEEHQIQYGTVYVDEFQSDPNIKEFAYVHTDGTRFSMRTNYLENSSQKWLSVNVLKPDTDTTFKKGVPWIDIAAFPLREFPAESLEFKAILIHYKLVAAKCDEAEPAVIDRLESLLLSLQISEAMTWLNANYTPSKLKLSSLRLDEFDRMYTFLREDEMEKYLSDPQNSGCLHYDGSCDWNTGTPM